MNKIDRANLSAADQLNYDLFQKDLEKDIEGFQFPHDTCFPINQRGGIQTADELGRAAALRDGEGLRGLDRAAAGVSRAMDQKIALMREGMTARMMWPKIVLERVPAQIEKQIVANPEESPFFKPFKNFPHGIAAAGSRTARQSRARSDRRLASSPRSRS